MPARTGSAQGRRCGDAGRLASSGLTGGGPLSAHLLPECGHGEFNDQHDPGDPGRDRDRIAVSQALDERGQLPDEAVRVHLEAEQLRQLADQDG